MSKLPASLTALLREKRWTLKKLSSESGVPISTLSGWTSGKSVQNLDQLKSVANALTVTVHYLAFGERDPHEEGGTEILSEIFRGDVRVTLQRIEKKKAG